MALQKATFDVAHARRQYDAVDPANRLVAGELERRWNAALMTVHRMVTLGRLQAKQVCRGAPWVLKAADVAEFAKNGGGNRPLPSDTAQQSLDFQ